MQPVGNEQDESKILNVRNLTSPTRAEVLSPRSTSPRNIPVAVVAPQVHISSPETEPTPQSSRHIEGKDEASQRGIYSIPLRDEARPPRLVLPPGGGVGAPGDNASLAPSSPGSTFISVLDTFKKIPPAEEPPAQEECTVFQLFTPESYQKLLTREAEDLKKSLQKRNPAEGRLVDGELKFDEEEDEGLHLERDPLLVEGNWLPEHLDTIFPTELYNKPIEEVDQYIKAKVRRLPRQYPPTAGALFLGLCIST